MPSLTSKINQKKKQNTATRQLSVISVFLTSEFSGYVFLERVELQNKLLRNEAVKRNRTKTSKRTVDLKVIDPY